MSWHHTFGTDETLAKDVNGTVLRVMVFAPYVI